MRNLTESNKAALFKRFTSGETYADLAGAFGVEKNIVIEALAEMLRKDLADELKLSNKSETGYIPSLKFAEIEELESQIFDMIDDFQSAKGQVKDLLSAKIKELTFKYSKWKLIY